MAAHKTIDRLCCLILVLTLALTLVFINGESLGIKAASLEAGYIDRLFDTSRVHTIDLVMDDWESFISSCENEEYSLCSVVIDNESYDNVGIRAKGNTSLTQVASYGNDRYSFKLEFDHYDSMKSYYGLDKISLNNIIQDNTYMKDYLSYQLMGSFGVSSPLCSYAYIRVNGNDWGLYLAVESVEEAFLRRNYGSSYGQLYKPDSMGFGGGRGNGGNFRMEDWEPSEAQENIPDKMPDGEDPGNSNMPQEFSDSPPESSRTPNTEGDGNFENWNDHFTPPGSDMAPKEEGESGSKTDIPQDFPGSPPDRNNMPHAGDGENDKPFDPSQWASGSSPWGDNAPEGGNTPEGTGAGFPNAMGGNDVSLIYTDDQYSSYENIFSNAKTEITDADRDRLIESLRQLNEQENIAEVVDTESVIRYFVVHNFLCNFDSYTGSMIHNYYLYESDSQLSMIPWDYNLAFGGFMGAQDAETLVNYPIDSPVSGGSIESRPMFAWIFAQEEYTQLYHQYFQEFVSQWDENLSQLISQTHSLISPYVEKDPTKFCTYQEFQTGVATLKEFCQLRIESISGQLAGTIPADSQGQAEAPETLIDAGELSIQDMGSMNGGAPKAGQAPNRQNWGNRKKELKEN